MQDLRFSTGEFIHGMYPNQDTEISIYSQKVPLCPLPVNPSSSPEATILGLGLPGVGFTGAWMSHKGKHVGLSLSLVSSAQHGFHVFLVLLWVSFILSSRILWHGYILYNSPISLLTGIWGCFPFQAILHKAAMDIPV